MIYFDLHTENGHHIMRSGAAGIVMALSIHPDAMIRIESNVQTKITIPKNRYRAGTYYATRVHFDPPGFHKMDPEDPAVDHA